MRGPRPWVRRPEFRSRSGSGVLLRADVDERRFQTGKHAPDLSDVYVSHQGLLVGTMDVMLHQERTLQDHHLGLVRQNPDQHLLAAGQRQRDDPGRRPACRRTLSVPGPVL